MELAAIVLSGLSFVAVVLIGGRQLRLGREQLRLARKSTSASQQSAAAAERAAEASVRAAAKAETDGVVRRLEAVLEVVIEMRALWNDQILGVGASGSNLVSGSPEILARLRLMRQLESRLVVVEQFADRMEKTENLVHIFADAGCGNARLEEAIDETKKVLRGAGRCEPREDA